MRIIEYKKSVNNRPKGFPADSSIQRGQKVSSQPEDKPLSESDATSQNEAPHSGVTHDEDSDEFVFDNPEEETNDDLFAESWERPLSIALENRCGGLVSRYEVVEYIGDMEWAQNQTIEEYAEEICQGWIQEKTLTQDYDDDIPDIRKDRLLSSSGTGFYSVVGAMHTFQNFRWRDYLDLMYFFIGIALFFPGGLFYLQIMDVFFPLLHLIFSEQTISELYYSLWVVVPILFSGTGYLVYRAFGGEDNDWTISAMRYYDVLDEQRNEKEYVRTFILFLLLWILRFFLDWPILSFMAWGLVGYRIWYTNRRRNRLKDALYVRCPSCQSRSFSGEREQLIKTFQKKGAPSYMEDAKGVITFDEVRQFNRCDECQQKFSFSRFLMRSYKSPKGEEKDLQEEKIPYYRWFRQVQEVFAQLQDQREKEQVPHHTRFTLPEDDYWSVWKAKESPEDVVQAIFQRHDEKQEQIEAFEQDFEQALFD